MIRWRPCDLSHLAGNITHSHNILLGIASQSSDKIPFQKTAFLRYVPLYVQHHRDVTRILGDIHEDIFAIIKKNGGTYDDITGLRQTREFR